MGVRHHFGGMLGDPAERGRQRPVSHGSILWPMDTPYLASLASLNRV